MATAFCSTFTQTQAAELEATADCFFRLVAMSDEEKKNLPISDKSHGYFHIVSVLFFRSSVVLIGTSVSSHFSSNALPNCCRSCFRASSTQL